MSPPGLEIMALPKRATIGPTSMTEPRRLEHFFRNASLSRLGKINVGSLKTVSVNAFFRYADSLYPVNQLDKVVDVQYVRDIVHSHLFGSELMWRR